MSGRRVSVRCRPSIIFSVGVSQVLISITLLLRQAGNRDGTSLRKKKSQLLRIFSIWNQTDKAWPGGVKHTFCVVSALPSAAQPSHFLIHTSSRVGVFFSTCHNLLIADKKTPQNADRASSQGITIVSRKHCVGGTAQWPVWNFQVDDQTCWFWRLTTCVVPTLRKQFFSPFIF